MQAVFHGHYRVVEYLLSAGLCFLRLGDREGGDVGGGKPGDVLQGRMRGAIILDGY